ncbi:MAG: hypothetical protein LBC88_03340, partial [Spirochaetaceae bacterium]|nr:hypothetical protein [Spirochaetaceae bacterium]
MKLDAAFPPGSSRALPVERSGPAPQTKQGGGAAVPAEKKSDAARTLSAPSALPAKTESAQNPGAGPAPNPHGISAVRLDVARLDVTRLAGFFRFYSLPLERGHRSLFLKETRLNGGESAPLARSASASKGV